MCFRNASSKIADKQININIWWSRQFILLLYSIWALAILFCFCSVIFPIKYATFDMHWKRGTGLHSTVLSYIYFWVRCTWNSNWNRRMCSTHTRTLYIHYINIEPYTSHFKYKTTFPLFTLSKFCVGVFFPEECWKSLAVRGSALSFFHFLYTNC